MKDLLIPFGVDKDTHEIIEPEDAAKGRECNCICPGCQAPLISRHPKDPGHRIHFAHDSRNKDAKPEEECPFNSALAVAMMARKIADQLTGKKITTPEHQLWLTHSCCDIDILVKAAQQSEVAITSAISTANRTIGHQVDITLMIGERPLLIDLVYDGKPPIYLDAIPLQEARAGLLEIDCNTFSKKSLREDPNLRFSEAVLKFILESGHREWRFHPRAAIKWKKMKQSHECPLDNPIRDWN